MIVNGDHLLRSRAIRHMFPDKRREHGVSHGLGEAGYDIRIKQDVIFDPDPEKPWKCEVRCDGIWKPGRFTIASAIEKFTMPDFLVGVVHDKSTWARKGLSVFNTVIEPGWKGFLTLELVYHGNEYLHIPEGAGIAQVLFSRVLETAAYDGKYQNQMDAPVPAIHEE